MQIKLLRCGLLTEADEVAAKLKDLLGKYDDIEKIPQNENLHVAEYEKLIKNTLGLLAALLHLFL